LRSSSKVRAPWVVCVGLVALQCGGEAPDPQPLSVDSPPSGYAPAGTERARELGPFLAAHWRLPVPAQGEPPPGFGPAEASLDPATCGACHPQQWTEWRTSLHAAAFSPGFAGQLIEGSLAAPHAVRQCQTCHTPLEEQQPWDPALAANAAFQPELRAQGIVCAACHVRAHQRFGPPRRAELPPPVEPVPHGGFEERTEYLESRFCAECHQFFDDAGIAGKPIENTYAEWQASPQAAAGRQCQDCHMPDRAHLWRGIHDRDMVAAALDVELVVEDLPEATGAPLRAALVIVNRDVGHAFPTYVTPRVHLAVYQAGASGAPIPGTRAEGTIGREVDLASGEEIFDTRVLPGESVKVDYALARAADAAWLVASVIVDPDFHYRGVFEFLLPTLADPEARRLIAQARRRTSESSYTLTEIRRRLPRAP
jgi:hypothetical protein